ncbi:MAG: adaptor protein MecA [Lachnospiraceae bacterium]|nr:adaptor protein MecA [Lachnospiraceae bacterium]
MKIEKVNDHQIRCTLTKADLADRELKISELAYGTEKAKSLFRDMMQQASLKFGFEAEDIPLMIEAIPLNSDCIVLIITKVEDPEELDTRFSKFAPSVHDGAGEEPDDSMDESLDNLSAVGDDVLDLFKRIKDRVSAHAASAAESAVENHDAAAKENSEAPAVNITRVFSFSSIHEIAKPAAVLSTIYDGCNSLYKNNKTGQYLLVVSRSGHSNESFNKVCNILSEYGHLTKSVPFSECFYAEHYEMILHENALQSLAF